MEFNKNTKVRIFASIFEHEQIEKVEKKMNEFFKTDGITIKDVKVVSVHARRAFLNWTVFYEELDEKQEQKTF